MCAETRAVGEKKAANTRLIRRFMMDSAAKTLSPTAESSMIQRAPRLLLAFILFWPPRVFLGLFNSAHPIIRNLEGTSSRLFLLPGTAAVGRIAAERIGSMVATCSGSVSGGEEPRCSPAGQECLAQGTQAGSTEPLRSPRGGLIQKKSTISLKGCRSRAQDNERGARRPGFFLAHNPFTANICKHCLYVSKS